TVGGTVGHAKATGDVELTNLVVTQTRPSCPEPKKRSLTLGNVKVNAVWEAPRFMGRPVTGSVAGGSLTTNATVTLEQTIHVDLTELTLKGVAIEKVLVDFLCQGYAVTGPTDDTGSLGVRLDDLWHTLNAQGRLRIGPGRVVGSQALSVLGNLARVGGAVAAVLGSELPNLGSSPVEYDSITATYTITNGVVNTRDFLLSGRSLKISAAGTYALVSGAVNLDVGVVTGRTELKGKVTGTTSSPSIRVAPPATLREVDPGKVEKGLQDLLKKFR
ncbi:MAG TPA: AsmA-like C-terminal region-containing protein, partial [bacterium]|nr:AsmA-like C-terminal region-containing protein [bacterium]